MLLSKLDSEKRYFTMKELSLYLNCSIRTIRRDIAVIQDFLPKEWEIKLVMRKGVILKKNLYASTFQSNVLCFKHSYLFQTFKIIMEENVGYIPHLADSLYLSVSAVYPVLKQVDEYLNKYKLSLQRNPLEIKGDEIQIILMYYELYQQAFSINEWPFDEYSKEFIWEWIQFIEESLNIQFHITTKQKLSYLVSIFLRRKKIDTKIYMDSNMLERIKQSRFYCEISRVCVKLLNKYDLELTAEDLAFLTIVVDCSRYIYKDTVKHINEGIHIFRKENPIIFKHIQEFIVRLEGIFKIPLINNDKLIFLIIDYLKRISYQMQYLSKIENPNGLTSKYIQSNYPYTFQQIKSTYEEWIGGHTNLDIFLKNMPDEDIAQITMHIEATKLFCNTQQKKVLLVTEEGDAWRRYIIALLSNIFQNKLIFVDTFITDIESEKFKDVDFVIATIPLEVNCYPVVYISAIPTNRDIDTISNHI
ncbi:BglG family transcription antiterminator [Bacillus albus]|uniref:BglG family transcription antiterminator n=1 Tax=Bacillus cereus group TaxID=86661 RepID=UPI001C108853|nr:helix-turn-helix domain-containing protein [Bacillus albus]MBU5220717.1 helix-turn-helix domain-containing protein [Bacillus albus]MCU4837019.1 helix-turn-helix domain-containing protein [Bacillus cereus]